MFQKGIFLVLAFFAGIVHLYGQESLFRKASTAQNIDSAIVYLNQYIKSAETAKDTASAIKGVSLLARKYMEKSLYARAEKILTKYSSSYYLDKHIETKAKLY